MNALTHAPRKPVFSESDMVFSISRHLVKNDGLTHASGFWCVHCSYVAAFDILYLRRAGRTAAQRLERSA
jgi:hypothetical protein